MFLAGGGVFIATFALSVNWDYRLVFLILCIPYILELKNIYVKNGILLAILAALNQWVLLHYFSKAGMNLNFACKSFLFVTLAALMYRELVKILPPRFSRATLSPQANSQSQG